MWKVPYAGRLRLTLSVIVRGKPITAATANANYSKPVSVKVVVKPTRAGKRTLARKAPLKVRLEATFTPLGGRASSVSKTVVIRRRHAS